MNSGKTLVVLVVAIAVVATTGWWWLGGETQSGPTAPPAVTPGALDPGSSTAQHSSFDRPDDPTAESSAAGRTTERNELTGGSSAGNASNQHGSVVGRIVNVHQVATGGVRVLVSEQSNWVRRAELLDPNVIPESLAASPVVVSDESGRFEIPAPSAKAVCRLVVGGVRYVVKFVTVPATAGSVVDVGDVPLEAGVHVAGRVLDLAGQPIAEARVRVGSTSPFEGLMETNSKFGAETDNNGRFELLLSKLGERTLRATHPDYASGTTRVQARSRGATIRNATIELATGVSITGRVSDIPAGEELQVRASALTDPSKGTELDQALVLFSAGSQPSRAKHRADVRSDGSFELQGLATGVTYRVFVVRESHTSHPIAKAVDVLAGTAGIEIPFGTGLTVTFRAMEAGSRVACTTLDVTSAVASAKRRQAFMFYREPDTRKLTSDETGRFVIDGLSTSDDDPLLSLTIRGEGLRALKRADIKLPLRGTLDLGTLELEAAPMLHVAVQDPSGAPVVGAKVTTFVPKAKSGDGPGLKLSLPTPGSSEPGWRRSRVASETDEQGNCRVTVEHGNSIRVIITHDNFAPAESETLELADGVTHEHRVTMAVGGSLVAHVVDVAGQPVPGMAVQYRRVVEGPGPGKQSEIHAIVTNAVGDAIADHLAPGRYRVALSEEELQDDEVVDAGAALDATEGATPEVHIEDSKQARITLTRESRGSISGIVTLNGVPVDGARVAVGGAEQFSPDSIRGDYGPGVKTNSAGRYELDDLDLGEVQLAAYAKGQAMATELQVTMTATDAKLDIRLSTAVVTGQAVDQDGQPIADAFVSASRATSDSPGQFQGLAISIFDGGLMSVSGNGDSSSRTRTDTDGNYRLEGVETGRPILVHVRSDNYLNGQSEAFEVADEHATRTGVVVSLIRAGIARVKLDPGGGFHTVRAVFRGEGPATKDKYAFSRDGEATLASLKPGEWTISTGGKDGPKEAVQIVAGETHEVDLRR